MDFKPAHPEKCKYRFDEGVWLQEETDRWVKLICVTHTVMSSYADAQTFVCLFFSPTCIISAKVTFPIPHHNGGFVPESSRVRRSLQDDTEAWCEGLFLHRSLLIIHYPLHKMYNSKLGLLLTHFVIPLLWNVQCFLTKISQAVLWYFCVTKCWST